MFETKRPPNILGGKHPPFQKVPAATAPFLSSLLDSSDSVLCLPHSPFPGSRLSAGVPWGERVHRGLLCEAIGRPRWCVPAIAASASFACGAPRVYLCDNRAVDHVPLASRLPFQSPPARRASRSHD